MNTDIEEAGVGRGQGTRFAFELVRQAEKAVN
jgi:hypothetical protein